MSTALEYLGITMVGFTAMWQLMNWIARRQDKADERDYASHTR